MLMRNFLRMSLTIVFAVALTVGMPFLALLAWWLSSSVPSKSAYTVGNCSAPHLNIRIIAATPIDMLGAASMLTPVRLAALLASTRSSPVIDVPTTR